MSAKRWPPPGFPIVEGDFRLTARWRLHLPERFARRIEDRSMVLWRPGLTLWIDAFGNDHGESRAVRLAHFKGRISKAATELRERDDGALLRFDYRLRDTSAQGEVESLNALVFSDHGQLHLGIYFDDIADVATARGIVDSVGT